MKKLTGGEYLAGHDSTSYGNFAAQTDAEMDLIANPQTLSSTGTLEVALANRTAVDMVLWSLWASAGGILSGFPEPGNLNNTRYYTQLERQVKRLLNVSSKGSRVVKMQE